jgi:nucleoside-diphosphate-sugar epimerase
MPGSAVVVPCIIAGRGREGLFVPFVRSMRRWGIAVVPGQGRNKVSLVHVSDVADLVAVAVSRQASGVFNAAALDVLSLREWVDEIERALGLDGVSRVSIPYGVASVLARGSLYRLLAREQLLMLRHDHVLSLDASAKLGWTPRWSNRAIVRETALALAGAP